MAWMEEKGEELTGGVKWLMILRVVIVTFMLGVTVLLQLREGTEFFSTPLRSLYLFIGLFYFLTILYSVAFHLGVASRTFAAFQICLDLLLVSGIVLVTGGVESLFSTVYFLAIIGGSTLFYRRGGYLTAGASILLYGAAVWAPFSQSVAARVDYEKVYATLSPMYVSYRILLNAFGFFLVAALTSHLAESLRRTGEELSAKSSSLAELERWSEHILQNITSGLLTMDLKGRINYVNRVAERVGGIASSDALDHHFFDIFEIKEGWNPFGTPPSMEAFPRRAEGWLTNRPREQFFGMTFSLLRDESGEVAGIICSFQDITQIRKMEEQMRRSDRLAAVGELAAGMAHEIRNPLASLSGSIQLLAEELVLEDTSRELMGIVNREVSRLESLITDFLRFANPRPLALKMTNLYGLLQETAALLQSPPGIWTVKVVARGEEDYRAEVDPTLMKQVFWNLARNAIEAMPGGGELTMGIAREAAGAGEGEMTDCLEIRFTDTGVGIPPEDVQKLFTPFHSTKEHGTGLGLAIVFKIVEAHRGRTEVESEPGRGATFSIRLPVRQAVATLAPLPVGEES